MSNGGSHFDMAYMVGHFNVANAVGHSSVLELLAISIWLTPLAVLIRLTLSYTPANPARYCLIDDSVSHFNVSNHVGHVRMANNVRCSKISMCSVLASPGGWYLADWRLWNVGVLGRSRLFDLASFVCDHIIWSVGRAKKFGENIFMYRPSCAVLH
jgi:hypothetical protein